MSPSVLTTVSGALVAVCAIAATTAAVVTGHVSGEAFVGIVTAFGGVGVGAGAHAAGTASAPNVTATAGPPPSVHAEPQ